MTNSMRKIYVERCDKLLMIFDRYFQGCYSNLDKMDLALMIATHGSAMGQIEPAINPKQKKKISRIIMHMRELTNDDQIFSLLNSKLEKAILELTPFLDFAELHGRQNNSNYREKIVLVSACHSVWNSYKEKKAPQTFQGYPHDFSNFVGDVIDEVFGYDFDARQAMDAYQNRK